MSYMLKIQILRQPGKVMEDNYIDVYTQYTELREEVKRLEAETRCKMSVEAVDSLYTAIMEQTEELGSKESTDTERQLAR